MSSAGTIRHDAWTEAELQVLYDRVNSEAWFGSARILLSNRTDRAIRAKMCALRRETGIIPGPGPSSKGTASLEIERATAGSDKLRRAIRELEAA